MKPIFNKLLFSGIILLLILLMQPLQVLYFMDDIPVLFPAGLIALKERNLLLFIQAVMLLFIVPVYIMTFAFSWWYRADNPKSKYEPHLVDNTFAEVIWWGVPLVMTIIVCVITWQKTFELDPYQPIESEKSTIEIQVVALDWKWLFIYPEEGIATVNYICIPKDHPVHFYITADAPMNSFWIPSLGGQIYAMPAMQTQLNLIANEEGRFRGSSAQISGKGFAWMDFVTEATTEESYSEWLTATKESEVSLDWSLYQDLAKPTVDHPVELFQLADQNLFHEIMEQYVR